MKTANLETIVSVVLICCLASVIVGSYKSDREVPLESLEMYNDRPYREVWFSIENEIYPKTIVMKLLPVPYEKQWGFYSKGEYLKNYSSLVEVQSDLKKEFLLFDMDGRELWERKIIGARNIL